MKNLILFLFSFLISCGEYNVHAPVIVSKKHHEGSWCFYKYQGLGKSEESFYDQCSLYYVGDTIIFKKK